MKVRTILTTLSTTLIVAGLAAVWAVASPLATSCASAAPLNLIVPAPSESSAFVAQINQLRVSKGLGGLSVDGNLTGIAQGWAANMASQGTIFHRLDLRDGVTSLWRRLGENVGVGPSVNELMQAFIASPGHYKNLVDPTFTHVGVGTVRAPDGLLYTAHEFAALEGAAPPVTVPSAPEVTTPRVTTPRVVTPRVTAPPTTAAPTTSTTEPPTTVEREVSPSHQDKLQDGGGKDDQQEQNENKGRCRSHRPTTVTA